MQNIWESRGNRKSALFQTMSRRSSLEVQLYFHALMFVEDCVQMKMVCTPRSTQLQYRYACCICCSAGDDGV